MAYSNRLADMLAGAIKTDKIGLTSFPAGNIDQRDHAHAGAFARQISASFDLFAAPIGKEHF